MRTPNDIMAEFIQNEKQAAYDFGCVCNADLYDPYLVPEQNDTAAELEDHLDHHGWVIIDKKEHVWLTRVVMGVAQALIDWGRIENADTMDALSTVASINEFLIEEGVLQEVAHDAR